MRGLIIHSAYDNLAYQNMETFEEVLSTFGTVVDSNNFKGIGMGRHLVEHEEASSTKDARHDEGASAHDRDTTVNSEAKFQPCGHHENLPKAE